MEKQKAFEHIMRLSQNFNIMCMWINNKYKYGKDIDDYLSNMGYKYVAIYGMGDIGECIASCLIKSKKIDLCCGIDRNPLGCYIEGLRIVNIFDIPDKVELIIVSLPDKYLEIKENIKVKQKLISIEEIVYGLMGGE